MRPETLPIIESLRDCNGVYALKTISPAGGMSYHHVRSIAKVLDWSSEKQSVWHIPLTTSRASLTPLSCLSHSHLFQVLDTFVKSSIKVVTITVTESGYYLDENASLDVSNGLIASDLKSEQPQVRYLYHIIFNPCYT